MRYGTATAHTDGHGQETNAPATSCHTGHTLEAFGNDRTPNVCPTPSRPAERNEHRMGIADLDPAMIAKVRKGPPCSVCEALGRLPEDERAALLRLLSDETVRYTELSAALAGEGIDMSAGTLSRHARGRCEARTKLRSA